MYGIKRQILAVFLAAALLLPFALQITASETVEMKVSIDSFDAEGNLIAEGEMLALGDTFTVRVNAISNPGIEYGTLYFDISDNIAPLSATYGGSDAEFKVAVVDEESDPVYGQNYGNYGIIIAGDVIGEPTSDYASMTFRVTGLGFAEVTFYIFQGRTENEDVVLSSDSETFARIKIEERKPVITTESLSPAVMGLEYSDALSCDMDEFVEWDIVDGGGRLPEGLELRSDGTVSGVPTEFGEFSFTVVASVFDQIVSDPKTVTLTVYEKPRKLELIENSTYEIEDETAYLLNVTEKTAVSDAIAQFENPSFIKAFNQNGTLLSDTDVIGTGCTVSLLDGETVMDTVTVIVLGDVDGSGEIGPTDYQRVRSHYLGNYNIYA